MSTVEQIEQLVRISREFGREVATGKEARQICKIGVFYDTRRRDAGRQRLRAERQGPPAGLSCARRPEMRACLRADRPDRPGPARPRRAALADAARGRRLPRVRSVPPMGRDDLDCAARVAAIEREAQAIDGPWSSSRTAAAA